MSENVIQATGTAAAAGAAQAPAPKDSAASGGQSAGSLFFEMLSSSLAGGLAVQSNPVVASELEARVSTGEPQAAIRNRHEHQNRVADFERGDNPSREIKISEDSSPKEKQIERETPIERPVQAAEKQDSRPETDRPASTETAKTSTETAKSTSEKTDSVKNNGTEPAREAEVKQTPSKPVVKAGGESTDISVKTVVEKELKEIRPAIEVKQPVAKAVKAPAAEVAKSGDATQQSSIRNVVTAGMARQTQEAAKPTNVTEIAQLINRSAAKAAQDSVQPSGNSQGAQGGGDPATGQSSQTATLMTMINAATTTVAQAGASTFAAAMQAQGSAPAQPAAQPSANATQVAAPAGPAAVANGTGSTAKAAEATPARPPMPAERVINQVIRGARISVDQGRGEIKMLLKPESLGWLKIKVSVENQNVTARITVENEGVRELLDTNIKQLQQALNQQNLKVTQIIVELNGDAEQHARQSDAGESGTKGSRALSIAGEGAETDQALSQPAEEALELGTVDVRV